MEDGHQEQGGVLQQELEDATEESDRRNTLLLRVRSPRSSQAAIRSPPVRQKRI